ncbi:Carboxylic ester hydrolase [Mycena kentingensis (nom. inval.)]|nr:Carboxylic ester hydrolase [Mycena kentingensis (nom. inval.)]
MHLPLSAAVVAILYSRFVRSGPVVDLGYAQYQGIVSSANYTHFFGIRYAAAPLGNLRFRAPHPPVRVTGIQNATVQPNPCFQALNGTSPTNPLAAAARAVVDPGPGANQMEDCLFLNVYYPSDALGTPPRGLPVLVWIHGGGYLARQASLFNGDDLLDQSNRNVVVVVLQYRLGLFGFLSGTKVKQDGELNAGLLDQDFAFRWVQQHIHKFGGDKDKVTIWGESAGERITGVHWGTEENIDNGPKLQHVIANGGNTQPPLFRAAITSSTFLPSQYRYNARIPELLFSKVVSQVGCSAAADTMACLRAVDANTLEAANININNAGFVGTFTLVPVVDGTFIQQRPTVALAQGKVNGEALLSVTNTLEGNMFVNQSSGATANATQYALNLFPNLQPAQAARVKNLYAGLGTPLEQQGAIQGEAIFICPTYYLLRAFRNKAFKGEFSIPPALHGFDLTYYFPSLAPFIPLLFPNRDFIDAFAQSFSAFVMSVDPNVPVHPHAPTILPKWKTWAQGRGEVEMLFNRTGDDPDVRLVRTDEKLLERCAFWESVGEYTGQ